MYSTNFPECSILHLSLINGIGPATIEKIIARKPSMCSWSDLYAFTKSDWCNIIGLSDTAAQRVIDGFVNTALLDQELALISKYGIAWTTILNDDYSPLLRSINAPPPIIYWRGENILNSKNTLAVIGSRKAGVYASQVIHALLPSLIAQQLVIVSGGAIGADSMAHEVTVNEGGKTIVVLGSGLINPYPTSNASLFKRVIEAGGMVLSIFPCATTAQPSNFPIRNRVISGIARGCLVVQAAQKSGTHITATYALEQGRDVFAIPGSITDPLSIGCHRLIQEGALLITKAEDILDQFGLSSIDCNVQSIMPHIEDNQQSSDDIIHPPVVQTLLKLCMQPQSCDDLIEKTDLPMHVLQTHLFQLQLDGYMQQDFTGRWIVL